MKKEVVELFNDFVTDAESYGAENLFLARRDEGYVGDPKEFRFSHVYARRLPMYKHELIVDYIDESSRLPHDRLRRRLRRRLTDKEADWMRREAKRIYAEELAHVSGSEKKSAAQLDAEIAEALNKRNKRAP